MIGRRQAGPGRGMGLDEAIGGDDAPEPLRVAAWLVRSRPFHRRAERGLQRLGVGRALQAQRGQGLANGGGVRCRANSAQPLPFAR